MTNTLLGVYESILEKIMMKRESKKRLRLNCGDENVEEIEGRDGKGELCSIILI